MRAPDDKKRLIRLPGFSGVPKYSAIESACRYAGEAPQGSASRRSLRRRLGELIRRSRGDINRREQRALIAYIKGEFDRKPKQGRPFDTWRHIANDNLVHIVQQVRREEDCTFKEAVAHTLVIAGIDDRDGRAFKSLLKRVTR
jgi:hypothetical protein